MPSSTSTVYTDPPTVAMARASAPAGTSGVSTSLVTTRLYYRRSDGTRPAAPVTSAASIPADATIEQVST